MNLTEWVSKDTDSPRSVMFGRTHGVSVPHGSTEVELQHSLLSIIQSMQLVSAPSTPMPCQINLASIRCNLEQILARGATVDHHIVIVIFPTFRFRLLRLISHSASALLPRFRVKKYSRTRGKFCSVHDSSVPGTSEPTMGVLIATASPRVHYCLVSLSGNTG